MSAYVVADETINKVVTFLDGNDRNLSWLKAPFLEIGYQPETREGRQALAEALLAMNRDAVGQRYEDGKADRPEPIVWRPVRVNKIAVSKAARCLRYQCTEGDVDTTPLYAALDQFSHRLAEDIVGGLPKFESAPWG